MSWDFETATPTCPLPRCRQEPRALEFLGVGVWCVIAVAAGYGFNVFL